MTDHIEGDVRRGHDRAFELGEIGSLLQGDDAIEQYLRPILGEYADSFLAVTDPGMLVEEGAGAMVTWTGGADGGPTLIHPGMVPEFVALHEAAHILADGRMPDLDPHSDRWLGIYLDLLDRYLPQAAAIIEAAVRGEHWGAVEHVGAVTTSMEDRLWGIYEQAGVRGGERACWDASLAVQRELGFAQVSGYYMGEGQREGHYWNEMPDGTIVDAAHDQFDEDEPIVVAAPGDPRYQKTAATESRRTAAWSDVREKAVRIRNAGQVTIEKHTDMQTVATVQGDHSTYHVTLWRTNEDNDKITTWECSCPWGYWAFRRNYQYVGRTCSHTLAVFYEARSRDLSKEFEYDRTTDSEQYADDPLQMKLDLYGPRMDRPNTPRRY